MSGNKVWRLVLSCMLLIILAGIGYVYVGFYGNPFIKMTMRSKVMGYLAEKYPSTEFTFERATYNFKVGAYGGVVHPAADPEISVHVDMTGGGRFSDNFLRARLEKEMLAAVAPLIDKTIPDASIFVTVFRHGQADDPETIHFSPGMDADMFLVVRWNGESISKQAFADQVAQTIRLLSGWNIKDWLFCYLYDKTELLLSLEAGPFDLDNLVEEVHLSIQKE